MGSINWQKEIQPLIKKYKGKPHPLEYNNNIYQLVVMVVLAAQDSDRNINKVAPELFKEFPDMKALSMAEPESLYPFVSKIRNFRNKVKWLLEMASVLKKDFQHMEKLAGQLEQTKDQALLKELHRYFHDLDVVINEDYGSNTYFDVTSYRKSLVKTSK